MERGTKEYHYIADGINEWGEILTLFCILKIKKSTNNERISEQPLRPNITEQLHKADLCA